jgi:hypothetical protein
MVSVALGYWGISRFRSPFSLDGKRMTWSYARSPRWNSDSDSLFGVSNDSWNPLPAARHWLARLSRWSPWRGKRTLQIPQKLGVPCLLRGVVKNDKQPVPGGADGRHNRRQHQDGEGKKRPHGCSARKNRKSRPLLLYRQKKRAKGLDSGQAQNASSVHARCDARL